MVQLISSCEYDIDTRMLEYNVDTRMLNGSFLLAFLSLWDVILPSHFFKSPRVRLVNEPGSVEKEQGFGL